MGEKAQYTQKGQKTLKIEILHSHPCGFYIKNRPFAIEMAVWGLGLLLLLIQWAIDIQALPHAALCPQFPKQLLCTGPVGRGIAPMVNA